MLSLHHISLSLGGLRILHNLSFEIPEGKITGLIGPNGAGKSTVFNVVTGLIPMTTGSVQLRGQELIRASTDQIARLGITRTFQDSHVLAQITVLENLIAASPLLWDISLFGVFFHGRQTGQRRAEAEAKALEFLRHVGLEGKAHVNAEHLSYGQKKLLELLKVMMSDAELILLDEPFSGLFPEMIKLITKLVLALKEKGKTIVFVEHNMKLIEEICDHVVVLDSGEKIAEGTFADVRKNKTVIEAYLGD